MTPSWVPARADLLLAVVVAAAAVVEVFAPGWSEQPASVALGGLALASGLALAWRRVAPLATLVVVLALAGAQTLLLGEPWDTASALVIPMVAVYTLGAHAPPARSVPGYLATVAGNTLIDVTDTGGIDWLFIALIMGAVWVAGLGVRRQRLLVAELADQSAELRAGHAAREQAVVADERSRIARELHDVIAHSVTTIVVQAEAGRAWSTATPTARPRPFEADPGLRPQGARRAPHDARRAPSRPQHAVTGAATGARRPRHPAGVHPPRPGSTSTWWCRASRGSSPRASTSRRTASCRRR